MEFEALFAKEAPEVLHLDRDIEIERLMDGYTTLSRRYRFEPGQVIKPKSGTDRYRKFTDHGYAVIMELVDPPLIRDDSDSGSTYWREPQDLLIGQIASHGFITFYSCSRWWEPV